MNNEAIVSYKSLLLLTMMNIQMVRIASFCFFLFLLFLFVFVSNLK